MTYIIMIAVTIPLAFIWQWQIVLKKTICLYRGCRFYINLSEHFWGTVAFIPIFFVFAFQYSIHSDYDNYEKAFLAIKAGSNSLREFGIRIINQTVADMGLNFQFVYILIYLIAFLVLAKCIKDYSQNYAMSMVLFVTLFFYLGFMQIRQLLAVVICFYSYRYILKHSFLKYCLATVIACSFHLSGLMMIPVYFLLVYDFKASYYFLITLFFWILNLKRELVLTFLVKTLLPTYYGRHEMLRNLVINKWDAIFICLLLLLCVIYYSRLNQKKTVDRLFINGFFIYSIVFFLGRWIIEFDRFAYYFYFPAIVLIPNLIECEKNINLKWLLRFCVPTLSIMIFIIKYNSYEFFNYVSIFG